MNNLNAKIKNIRHKIYKILSPTYREICKLDKEILEIKKLLSKNFYENCSDLFKQKDLDPNYKRDLCAKFLLMSQDDIVKNLCDYIVRGKQFLIFDIGANKGDISKIMLSNNNTSNSLIFGYEPIIAMQPKLQSIKLEYTNFGYKMIGIGEHEDRLVLKYNPAIDGLTSFKALRNDYKYFACNKNDTSIQEDLYEVDINTLDNEYFGNKIFENYKNIALKIDVQGFEMEVLNGCSRLFAQGLIKAVLIECTTVQKYCNAVTYETIFNFFHGNGFKIFDLLPVYREINGEFHQDNKGWLTEFDVIFVQNDFILENKV